jgi:Protein of unknown function (DUF1566)
MKGERPGHAGIVNRRWVWVSAFLACGCSSSGSPAPVDARDAGDDRVESGPDVADAPPSSCTDAGPGSAWAPWPMPDPTATPGAPSAPSYDVSSGDVVVDRVTGLMWQRAVGLESYGWDQANAYCDCSTTGAHDDWRLPTRIELLSIVDFTKGDPAIDGNAFPSAPSDYFWTSSSVAGSPDAAWYLYFFDGNTHSMGKDTAYRVRCVRTHESAVASAPSFTVSGDGTVVDAKTKLVWQLDVDPMTRTWSDAKTYCETLALAGGGFRLPNMKELQTLIDESTADPAIVGAAFPAAPSESFWTATPLAADASESWFVNFYNGVAYTSLVDHTYRARCVR